MLATFLFHPDTKSIAYNVSFFSFRGILNIYDYLVNNQGTALYSFFPYPPLTYFTLGTIQFLLRPFLGPHFMTWLLDASANSFLEPRLFRFLFLTKWPLLILDMALAFTLIRLVPDERSKKKEFSFFGF